MKRKTISILAAVSLAATLTSCAHSANDATLKAALNQTAQMSSGGMTTEMCNTLSAAGLGQSTAVSIGGDAVIGSTYADLMPLYEADPETQAIVIYCEPGGRMEEVVGWLQAGDLLAGKAEIHPPRRSGVQLRRPAHA